MKLIPTKLNPEVETFLIDHISDAFVVDYNHMPFLTEVGDSNESAGGQRVCVALYDQDPEEGKYGLKVGARTLRVGEGAAEKLMNGYELVLGRSTEPGEEGRMELRLMKVVGSAP
jgi:hypothetical protein